MLGSSLSTRLVRKGWDVTALDVSRIDEAWRLAEVRQSLKYVWKASNDIVSDDLRGKDVILDSGIGVADRPLGNSSPTYVAHSNIEPSLRLLEAARHLPGSKPTLIYPSSFNALYGYASGTTYRPEMTPNPSSLYGWTKAAVELLYSTYHKAYQIPTIITRVGSGYGPGMRSDELPARLMLDILQGRAIHLKSPKSRRLWTFLEDAVNFYERLLENPSAHRGQVLHCAGNKGNRLVTNLELAKMIVEIGGKQLQIREDGYEAGELIERKPVNFRVASGSPLWRPKHTLLGGMKETFDWFRENLWRYR